MKFVIVGTKLEQVTETWLEQRDDGAVVWKIRTGDVESSLVTLLPDGKSVLHHSVDNDHGLVLDVSRRRLNFGSG